MKLSGLSVLPNPASLSRKQNISFAGNSKISFDDVKALQDAFDAILLGRKPVSSLETYQSEFKLSGLGITYAGGNSALSAYSKTEAGRDKIIERLLRQPGAKEETGVQLIAPLGKGDKVVSLPFQGKQISVVVRYSGPISIQAV